jgi:putative membrane protein
MKFILDILRGVVIGIANVIPGVSGGTLAVSMGIYDKIITSVNNLFKKFKKSFRTLLPYGIGIVLGIIGLSFAISYLFEHHPLPTILLFIGLILGGIPVILKKVFMNAEKKPNIAVCIILFVVFAAMIVVLPLISGNTDKSSELVPGFLTVVKMLFSGIIASATMVIPGVSGSMILMAIGYYNVIINSIKGFVSAAVKFDFAGMLTPAALLLPFGIGVILGIWLIAKLISFLLRKFEIYTYSAILGLVAASPYAIFASNEIKTPDIPTVVFSVIALALGLACAFFLARKGEPKKEAESEEAKSKS